MSDAPDTVRIACHDLTKYYRRAKVLDGVTFSVHRGKMLGLIGPGGAGKSLIVKIICGLVDADGGRVEVDGVDISGLSESEIQSLREKMGMVFQNYALFDFMNVGENIALPLRMQGTPEEELRERVADILEKVALPGIQHKLVGELSGGMKKRVSFARAVIRRPPIVIYDDPTAGLDPVTSAKIFRLLEDMQAQGTTSITISHDLDGLKPLCDEWLLVDHGRLVFHGDTDAIERCGIDLVRRFWRA